MNTRKLGMTTLASVMLFAAFLGVACARASGATDRVRHASHPRQVFFQFAG